MCQDSNFSNSNKIPLSFSKDHINDSWNIETTEQILLPELDREFTNETFLSFCLPVSHSLYFRYEYIVYFSNLFIMAALSQN